MALESTPIPKDEQVLPHKVFLRLKLLVVFNNMEKLYLLPRVHEAAFKKRVKRLCHLGLLKNINQ